MMMDNKEMDSAVKKSGMKMHKDDPEMKKMTEEMQKKMMNKKSDMTNMSKKSK